MDFLRLLANYRCSFLNVVFQSITWIAQETIVVIVICWLYWCCNKKLAHILGFTYFLSGLLVQALKITFRIPRPWILDPDFKAVESAVPGATGYSFPSGHTQSGTALFSTLGFHFQKKAVKFICFFIMCLIGFSRMYLGVHTHKDVLVSMALTFIISFIVYNHLAPKLNGSENIMRLSFGLLTTCLLLFAYAGILYCTHIADPDMAADALKAGGAGLGFALGYYIEQTRIRFSMPKSAKEKALRFTTGLFSVIVLMVIFHFTIKKFLIGNIISYFLLILWIVAFYPAIFSYVSYKQEGASV